MSGRLQVFRGSRFDGCSRAVARPTLTRSPSPHLGIPIQVEHRKYDDEFVRHSKVNGIREGVKERLSDDIGDCGELEGRSRTRVNVRSRSETKRAQVRPAHHRTIARQTQYRPRQVSER